MLVPNLNFSLSHWQNCLTIIEFSERSFIRQYVKVKPLRVKVCECDYRAAQLGLKFALACANNFYDNPVYSEKILKKEIEFLTQSNIVNRSKAIRCLAKNEKIEIGELRRTIEKYLGDTLILRCGEMRILDENNQLLDAYPRLDELPEKFKNVVIGNTNKSRLGLADGILEALKILVLHPFMDCNGRVARMIISSAIMNEYNLNFVPYLDGLWRLRKSHISGAILYFRKYGDFMPFFYAVIGAIRDSVEN